MEKILENLKEIILNGTENIPNPDAITSILLKADSDRMATAVLGEYYGERNDLIQGVHDDSDFLKLLDASSKEELREIATLIKKMGQEEGISLKGKSVASILWATTIYGFITQNREHKNIFSIQDSLEIVTFTYFKKIANKDIIKNLQKEVQSIFHDSNLKTKVDFYLATAHTLNDDWKELYENMFNGNDYDSDLWFEYDTLNPINLNTDSVNIKSDKDLVELLSIPDPNNYSAAIEYIKEKYFSEKKPTEAFYYSYTTICFIASALLKENIVKAEDKTLFNDIAFNMYIKFLYSREAYEKALKENSILSSASNIIHDKIKAVTNEALALATTMCDVTKQTQSIDTDEEIKPNTKKPKIKAGTRKAYINAYLNLFESLITTKRQTYADLTEKLLKPQKEINIIKIAEEYKISGLKSEIDLPFKNERVSTNQEIVRKALIDMRKTLSETITYFNKLRIKLKDEINIQDLTFGKKLLGETPDSEIHEIIIKQFYKLIANDPILKQDSAKYRMYFTVNDSLMKKNTSMALEELRTRIEENSNEYSMLTGLIPAPDAGKPDGAKLVAHKTILELYVNGDATINEEFEELYATIKDTKTSAEQKETALKNVEKDITAEQLKAIQEYIDVCKNKEKAAREKEEAKNKEQEYTQPTLSVPETDPSKVYADEDEKE